MAAAEFYIYCMCNVVDSDHTKCENNRPSLVISLREYVSSVPPFHIFHERLVFVNHYIFRCFSIAKLLDLNYGSVNFKPDYSSSPAICQVVGPHGGAFVNFSNNRKFQFTNAYPTYKKEIWTTYCFNILRCPVVFKHSLAKGTLKHGRNNNESLLKLITNFTTVKNAWIPGLNLNRFWRFYSLVFSAFNDQFGKL